MNVDSPGTTLVGTDMVKTFKVRRTLREAVLRSPAKRLVALDHVSVRLASGQILGVVGESGSGKSTLAYCLVRLLELDGGRVELGAADLAGLSRTELQRTRRRIQLIFQDPYASLNPRITVGAAIAEPARAHKLVEKSGEKELVVGLLERVGLRRDDARRYPRQLSGGQRQRVAIARALAVQPDILIADEAVSSLDVSVQAQILNLLMDLQSDLGVGIILISHQLSVVAYLATDVSVMYLGRIVESGPMDSVFGTPRHPYTMGLLEANPAISDARLTRKPALQGELPSPLLIPSGCCFHPRCKFAQPICRVEIPSRVEVAPGHFSSCHVFAPAEQGRNH
jgi:oligopeptide/dipeptide ABC transporter ATP-binding protein